MGLEQVTTTTVTSAVGYVDIIGTTTDDVYTLVFDNVQPVNDVTQLICRVLVSSSPDTTSNYDRAWWSFSASGGNSGLYGTNEVFTYISGTQTGTATQETNNGILHLYNFNNASEHSFVTVRGAGLNYASSVLVGILGGWTHTVTQSCNGLRIYFSSGNIASGTFTLYKQV